MTESRRRRFVSVSRVLSQYNDTVITVIDAICEEGRAWWLVIGPENAFCNWSELRPLPEIEVEVTEPTRPTPAPAPAPEVAPAATDEDLLAMRSWSSHGPTFDSDLVEFGRAIYNLGRQHGAAQPGTPVAPVAPAPALVPVAVSKRLPREEDCFFYPGATIGSCWCFDPVEFIGETPWWSFEPVEWTGDATHWLLHYAFPLPHAGEVQL